MNETKQSRRRSKQKTTLMSAAMIALAACGIATAVAVAQDQPQYVPSPDYSSPPVTYPAPGYRMEADQLDQLTAPIALYPDPLIAEILPASTYPTEVLAAAQWVKSAGVPAQNQIDAQPWEPAVRALVHYPTVLQMMADRSDWMEDLGTAFVNQPDDVMDSIQRLRAEAQANGALVSTPQQDVVDEDNEIYIRPTADNVIYIPEYDPTVVFVAGRHFDRGFIHFGVACPIGVWLNYGPDWRQHFVREDVHWDHWHQEHHDQHGPVHVVHAPAHRWERNPDKPIVVIPHRPTPERRGFEPHAPATPAPGREIGNYQPRREAEREENRGRASLHQPARPAPHPAPRPEPRAEPAHPAPHPEPPHPEPHGGDNGHGKDGGHK